MIIRWFGALFDLLQGNSLLRSPYHNKGSAFTAEERQEFILHGKLPPNIQTLDEQVRRAYQQYRTRPDALAKNVFMTSMKEQNEVLFYRVIVFCLWSRLKANWGGQLIQEHLKEMFSIIYTPTEGDAIQNYSRLFRKPEGCFLNVFDQDRIENNLAQFGDAEDIDYIVVSDGEEVIPSFPSILA
jgi:malate dehydrogenase (oxaloacetate-decarboxylating)